jgi:hypothetical protein
MKRTRTKRFLRLGLLALVAGAAFAGGEGRTLAAGCQIACCNGDSYSLSCEEAMGNGNQLCAAYCGEQSATCGSYCAIGTLQ